MKRLNKTLHQNVYCRTNTEDKKIPMRQYPCKKSWVPKKCTRYCTCMDVWHITLFICVWPSSTSLRPYLPLTSTWGTCTMVDFILGSVKSALGGLGVLKGPGLGCMGLSCWRGEGSLQCCSFTLCLFNGYPYKHELLIKSQEEQNI